MILDRPTVTPDELFNRTGWAIKAQGACLGDVCVPLAIQPDEHGDLDAAALAERLGMPLLHDDESELWALGPSTVTGRTLASAEAPDLTLPDRDGDPFTLASRRGDKVLLVAWASW